MPPLTAVVGGVVRGHEGEEEDDDGPIALAAVWAGRASRVSPTLHEVKCISNNGTGYKPSWKDRVVDIRAGLLPEK